MATITYSIDQRVFDLFPDFIRGVLVARDVVNQPSPEELIVILREEEEEMRRRVAGQEIAVHPRINSWREAFRKMGVKPSEYRSSIEAMARRVANGHQLPAINALVDIGNIISLRYLIPTGGHALIMFVSQSACGLQPGMRFCPIRNGPTENRIRARSFSRKAMRCSPAAGCGANPIISHRTRDAFHRSST